MMNVWAGDIGVGGVPVAALAWWVAPRLTWARPGVRRWVPRLAGAVILACTVLAEASRGRSPAQVLMTSLVRSLDAGKNSLAMRST